MNHHHTLRVSQQTNGSRASISVARKSPNNYSIIMSKPSAQGYHAAANFHYNNNNNTRTHPYSNTRVVSERKDLLNYEDGDYRHAQVRNTYEADKNDNYYLDTESSILDRLPLLQEVLNKQTVVPVDLWSFYTFISKYPQANNCLDFYIDMTIHLRFCKEYVRDIRKSVRSFIEREDTAHPHNTQGNLQINKRPRGSVKTTSTGNTSDETVPSFLLLGNQNKAQEQTTIGASETAAELLGTFNDGINDTDMLSRQDITQTTRDSKRISVFLNNDLQSQLMSNVLKTWRMSSLNITNEELAANSQNESVSNMTPSDNTNNHGAEIERGEEIDAFVHSQGVKSKLSSEMLLKNAESIVNTYLLSSTESPKYLSNLPSEIKTDILQQVLVEKKYDPEIFEGCKEITFQILEQDMFPIFLEKVCFHNLHDKNQPYQTRSSLSRNPLYQNANQTSTHIIPGLSSFQQLNRIAAGLLFLWVGLWVGYTLIFLDYSRQTRVVTLVPFVFAWYYIVTGITKIDLIYAWYGITNIIDPTPLERLNEKERSVMERTGQNQSNEKIEHYDGNNRFNHSKNSPYSSDDYDNNSETSFINHAMKHKTSWNLLELGVFSAGSQSKYHEIPWFIRIFHGGFFNSSTNTNTDEDPENMGKKHKPSHTYIAKIQSPFIKNLIRKRSIYVTIYILLLAAVSTVIFSCVPGHRL